MISENGDLIILTAKEVQAEMIIERAIGVPGIGLKTKPGTVLIGAEIPGMTLVNMISGIVNRMKQSIANGENHPGIGQGSQREKATNPGKEMIQNLKEGTTKKLSRGVQNLPDSEKAVREGTDLIIM